MVAEWAVAACPLVWDVAWHQAWAAVDSPAAQVVVALLHPRDLQAVAQSRMLQTSAGEASNQRVGKKIRWCDENDARER